MEQPVARRDPRNTSLKRSCDFCVKRKRSCDGFGRKCCSFCIANKQPECRYSYRQPYGTSTRASSEGVITGNDTSQVFPLPPRPIGRSSAPPTGQQRAAARSLLPLKRTRFSVSPATGLIGLQENGFLGDFYRCLGFLSLANESIVRTAMVDVMLATGPVVGEAEPPPLAHASEGASYPVGGGIDQPGRCWPEAEAAGDGKNRPSNASTCLLWSAIALGALVRGCPLKNVERYVDLAQESLVACVNDATLDTAGAYLAVAVMQNFLGNQERSNGYLKAANIVVAALPVEQLPTGIHEVLRYAGKAWVFERELATAEEINDYWESATPIWKMPEAIMEKDVCGLVLSVDVLVDQTMFEKREASRVFLAKEKQLPGSGRMASSPISRSTGAEEAGGNAEGGVLAPSAAVEADSELGPVDIVPAAMHKQAMPEMLRLGEYFRSANNEFKTHEGLLDVLYYRKLGFLQALNDDIRGSRASFYSALDAMLRYPGLFRYNCVSHLVHTQLWGLANRRDPMYEELRAAYNPMRRAGSPPAPPLEEWQGMSSVCEHPYCRGVIAHVGPIFKRYGTATGT